MKRDDLKESEENKEDVIESSEERKECEFPEFEIPEELQKIGIPEDVLKQIHEEIQRTMTGDEDSKGKKIHVICANGPGMMPNPKANEKLEAQRKEIERFKEKLSERFIPKDIVRKLNPYVVGQDEAKKALAVAICDHYNHVRMAVENPQYAERDYTKHNVLLLGPTGVGKTYLIRCIAKSLGVPFVKADATKFSETGYIGYDVEDIIRDLVRNANNNVEIAQYGIVYIDEIDKIAGQSSSGGHRDVNGRGVQINLLKMMEDSEVRLLAQNDMVGQMQMTMQIEAGLNPPRTIQTRHILFIVSGAFSRLTDIITQRLGGQVIGFHSDTLKNQSKTLAPNLLHQVTTDDLVNFGFESEFVGRLPVRVALNALTEKDLYHILTKPKDSLLEDYIENFAGYRIDLSFEDKALRLIAKMALAEKTGARGLVNILERVLRPYKYELPGGPLSSLLVTERMVKDPEGVLKELVQSLKKSSSSRTRKAVEK